MRSSEPSNLWRLALSGQPIDVHDWLAALDQEATPSRADFRTRLLVRDGLEALSAYWPQERLNSWLSQKESRLDLLRVWKSDLGEVRFPSLGRRLMEATRPETVMQFFRALGQTVPVPSRIEVGGSTALILRDLLIRHTEDIDVVNEVPSHIRTDHEVLRRLSDRFGLNLTHFQSHYLPSGWRDRIASLGRFGQLDIYLVDAYDVLLGKLFSAREKDQDDLRAVAGLIEKSKLVDRLHIAGGVFLSEPKLAQHARDNWYIVYGEDLPLT